MESGFLKHSSERRTFRKGSLPPLAIRQVKLLGSPEQTHSVTTVFMDFPEWNLHLFILQSVSDFSYYFFYLVFSVGLCCCCFLGFFLRFISSKTWF